VRVARAKSMLGVVGTISHRRMPPNNDTSTQLPIGISDAIPKRTWEKKAYGLVDVARLTTALITQKDLAIKEKLLQKVLPQKAKAEKWRHVTRLRLRPHARGPR
jgi:hypothetical protein